MTGKNYLTLVPVFFMSVCFFVGNFRCTSMVSFKSLLLFLIHYHQKLSTSLFSVKNCYTMSVIKYVAKCYYKSFAIAFLELKHESYENISMESNAKTSF